MSDQPVSSAPLSGECVTFTGTLASMTHEQAGRLVKENGGDYSPHMARQVSMLVVGEEGWPLEEDGSPSQKLLKANEWVREAHEIRVLPESDWLYLLGISERQSEVHRHYTPAMLSQMLDVPVTLIRRWARQNLIRPVKTVYRLPYFDFAEVASVRKLAGLLADGVAASDVETSLRRLRELLPSLQERSLAQLELLAGNSGLEYRDEHSPIEARSGHRLLDFDKPDEPPPQEDDDHVTAVLPTYPTEQVEDWFVEGCRLLEDNRLEDSIVAFRRAMLQTPGDPEVNFHLAETLYRLERNEAAAERYYAAIEFDPNYLEAWTALGCIQSEQGNDEDARESFASALELHPEYPDAHWHLGTLADRNGDISAAITHWKAYLQYDERGPWADAARQSIQRLQDD